MILKSQRNIDKKRKFLSLPLMKSTGYTLCPKSFADLYLMMSLENEKGRLKTAPSDSPLPPCWWLKNYAFDQGLNLDILLNSAGVVLHDEAREEAEI